SLSAEGKITLNEVIASGDELHVVGANLVENNATLYSQKNVTIKAEDLLNKANIVQGTNNVGGIVLDSNTLTNQGQIISANSMNITVDNKLNNEMNSLI